MAPPAKLRGNVFRGDGSGGLRSRTAALAEEDGFQVRKSLERTAEERRKVTRALKRIFPRRNRQTSAIPDQSFLRDSTSYGNFPLLARFPANAFESSINGGDGTELGSKNYPR